MGEEVNAYLEIKGAEACTLNASTILFRERPSRAAVYEEFIHVQQFCDGKIDGSIRSIYMCEIEAKQQLQDILALYEKAYL